MTDRIQRYERTNRAFWDDDADDYQAAHRDQLDRLGRWGVWGIPEAELGAVGDLTGLDVLELGCGAAQHSIGVAAPAARRTGLDLSLGQLRHAVTNLDDADLRMPLVCASATATPFRDASFDLVFCDHGAMSFCDPDSAVPEVARITRAGGRFVFNLSTLLRYLCFPPDDPDAPITKKLRTPYFGARAFDWGDGTVDFQIPHGDWIRLFARHGFVVEDLIEIQAPADATSTYTDYAHARWARRWPAEEIWKVRKLA
ncbi:MAG: class I SAM-dependent methyltransferase [Acidimicrobiia bacterium]|nr:class I SAM-dependent methyltransferase [Acidimicrobiia bacterium]